MIKKRLIVLCIILISFNKVIIANDNLDNLIRVNVTDFDLGFISSTESPVSAVFEILNISKEPILIQSIVQDCRCLDIEWDKGLIMPAHKGRIKVIYSHTGEYRPFHKSIGVRLSCTTEILHLSVSGQESFNSAELKHMFPYHNRGIGFKDETYNLVYIPSNIQYQSFFPICNLSSSILYIELNPQNEDLLLSVSPNPIPANSVAEIHYSFRTPRNPQSINIPVDISLIRDNGKNKVKLKNYIFRGHVIQKSNELFSAEIANEYTLGKIKSGTDFHIEIKKEGEGALSILNIEAPSNYILLTDIPKTITKENDILPIHINPFFSLQRNKSDELIIYTNSSITPILRVKINYRISLIQTIKYYLSKLKGRF